MRPGRLAGSSELRQEGSSASASDLTSFDGRADLIGEAKNLLLASARLVTLFGVGGVGKAKALARRRPDTSGRAVLVCVIVSQRPRVEPVLMSSTGRSCAI